ncbi:MAG: hypothetical protein IPH13_12525 [Planctomycetes bacterium]|nr:hypothetical protein [Planctomycetota bacterium]MCC7169774.1 hypothetical protein [Planctomycetota bacterium]
MSGRAIAAFAAGAAAVVAAGLAFLAFPTAVAAIPLVVCAALLWRAPGAVLAGAATAAGSFSALLAHVDPRTGSIAAGGFLGIAAWIASRGTSAVPVARSFRTLIAAALVVAAVCGLCARVVVTCRFLAGPDLPGLAAAVFGVLATAAVGAATARFLAGRHGREAPLLLLAVAAFAALGLMRLSHDPAPWVDRAIALHGPNVSRTQFLAGCALLAALVAGAAGVAIGGVLGALSRHAAPPRRLAVALAIGAGLALFFPLSAAAFPAACVGLAVACVIQPAALAALCLLVALTVGVVEGRRDPVTPIPRQMIRSDQVYVELGVADGIDRALARESAPAPAWPLADGVLDVVRFVDRVAPPGVIAIAPSWAPATNRLPSRPERSWFVHDDDEDATRRPAMAWIAPCEPSDATHARAPIPPRLLNRALVVRPLDLWRVTPRELDAWIETHQNAVLYLFGRFLVRVDSSTPIPSRPGGPFLAFAPVDSASSSAEIDPRLRASASARTRLVPDLPRTGARSLEHLLARSTVLRADDVPTLEARARLELAIAILRDDADAEDRGWRLLEATAPTAIAASRGDRDAARERVWLHLAQWRAADPTDADVRFRFGTVLGRGLSPLAGVEELTRCVEFRPTLVDAYEELARSYLAAARRNEFKWTATGALDISYAVERLVVLMHPDRVDVAAQARMSSLLGRARRAKALRLDAASERAPLLNDALGRFHRALDLVPDDPETVLHYAITLRELGEDAGAARFADQAATLAPLDARAHALRAATSRDTDPEAARAALRTAFRFGSGFPPTRSR